MKLLFVFPALILLATLAQAQTGDWARLKSTRHGSTLIIETNVNAYGPAVFTRCRLLRVDTNTLTCMQSDSHTHVTFPASSLDAVYQAKQSWVPPVLGGVVVGCLIGGLLSGNPPAIAIGLIGGLVWLIAEGVGDAHRRFDIWTGSANNPLPDDEHRVLLYLRP